MGIFKGIGKIMNLMSIICVVCYICNPLHCQAPIEVEKVYSGYRLSISNVQFLSEKKNSLKFTCDIANTGREPISLGRENFDYSRMILEMDPASQEKLKAYSSQQIEDAFFGTPLQLQSGAYISQVEVVLSQNSKKNKVKVTQPAEVEESTQNTEIHSDLGEELCSDLIIDSIWVMKNSKKYVVLGFSVKNQGLGKADFYATGVANESHLALNVHFSGTKTVTRGSVPVTGIFMGYGLHDTKGYLEQGKQWVSKIKIPISGKSQYQPYIILTVDTFQKVQECNEVNNSKGILY